MRNKLAQKIKLGAALLLFSGTSALAQISNQIYIPTPENTLVTMGMGAHRMNVPEELAEYKLERAELAIALPPDWKLDEESLKDERCNPMPIYVKIYCPKVCTEPSSITGIMPFFSILGKCLFLTKKMKSTIIPARVNLAPAKSSFEPMSFPSMPNCA